MNTGGQAVQPGPNSPARIWYQSFVDPAEERPYMRPGDHQPRVHPLAS
jgi:hypothetical protein